MIQATPFDLTLFAVDIDPQSANWTEQLELALNWFKWCREQLQESNRRLNSTPSLGNVHLKVPMTGWLFEQLCEIPPWPRCQQGGPATTLKISILSFISSRSPRISENPILRLEIDTEWKYQITKPNNFFSDLVHHELKEAWTESVGICAFQRCDNIVNSWVVSPGRQHLTNHLALTATDIYQEVNISRTIELPMMINSEQWPEDGKPNIWIWECALRRALWCDERLPFSGPNGSLGFHPHPDNHWHPGGRLTMKSINGIHGYLDELGGLWQWEGGRAITDTPFDGHWNIQLSNHTIQREWVRYLEVNINQRLELQSNHINIDADGRITDRTFDVINLPPYGK